MSTMRENPVRVFCFSGKRKTGKDFITEILHQKLPSQSIILRLSAPIKQHWAKYRQLNLEELMSDGSYKENHRLEMIRWSEEQRGKDPSCFCKAAIELYQARNYPIWIVSDARRSSDLQFFKENYGNCLTTVRICALEQTRKDRGFHFTNGVDDAESECGLDHITDWDVIIQNDGDSKALEDDIGKLTNLCKNID